MSISVIDHIGEGELPVKVEIEYQKYRPAEIIDGLSNPEVEPHVEILNIKSFGFDIDDILTAHSVDDMRERIKTKLVNKDLLELENE